MTSSPTALDVLAFIDRAPLARLQYRVFFLCFLSVLLDGYDTQAAAYIAPLVSRSWHLPPGSFGPVFAAGLIGSALGSLLLAPLSDRLGRRRIILASTVLIGVTTLLCGWAQGLGSLQLLRFLSGLGLGATLPNALALIAEYAPDRRRTTIVSLSFCGLAVGGALGGAAAALLMPLGGWPSVFIAGGALTVLYFPLLLWLLPESLSFLALRRPEGPEAQRLARQLTGTTLPGPIHFAARNAGQPRSHLALLFREGRASVTVTYGLLAFLTLLTLYLLNNWLPTLIQSMGFPPSAAAWSTAAFQLGGIAGTILLGLLADRIDSLVVVVLAYLAAAAALCGASVAAGPPLVATAAFAAGFSIIGAQSCNNAMVAGLYSTPARGAALGWNLAFGRVGSILGPTITGVLLMLSFSAQRVLLLSALPVACAALLVLVTAGAIRRALARARIERQ